MLWWFHDRVLAQQYLPDKLVDRRYYEPSEEGYEARIKARYEALLEERSKGAQRRSR